MKIKKKSAINYMKYKLINQQITISIIIRIFIYKLHCLVIVTLSLNVGWIKVNYIKFSCKICTIDIKYNINN